MEFRNDRDWEQFHNPKDLALAISIEAEGGHWELSPAYDLCHAYHPGSEWVSQHALSINGKRKAITKADLMVIGESIRCKKASDIVDEINDKVNQWKGFADEVGVEASLRDQIGRTLVDLI